MKNKKISVVTTLLAAAFVVTAVFLLTCQFKKGSDFNVVLITIDTLRADHLGCYGYARNTSPFIDYLAENGVLFQNALASISHTTPSHASIFSSLYPVQHGILINGPGLHDSVFTMAKMFQDIGYETAGFCSVDFLSRLRQGFDIVDSEKYKEKAHYRQAHHTVDCVLDWLNEKKSSKKFFLWVHLFDPHRPYHPPKKHLKKMELKSKAEKDIFINYLTEIHKLPEDFYKHSSELIQDYNNYDAEILFVDEEIERLFYYMDEIDSNSNTLWIITADHGEGLGNHYYEDHSAYIYTEQMHIPLIFYFSSRDHAGIKVDKLVRHVDIFPSISDLVGYNLDKKAKFIQGVSLLPLMRNIESNFPVEYAFFQRKSWDDVRPKMEPGEIYALQNLEFKYIYHSEGKDEFYNLRYDPFESKNLIDFPSEERDRMKKILKLRYDILSKQTIENVDSQIDKKHIEELKALGYIR